MAKTTLSATLGDFVYDLSFEDLPATVVERAKISIADGIACAFDGRHMPSSEIALNTWKEMKRAGNVTLWVNGEKADLESTAWANCTRWDCWTVTPGASDENPDLCRGHALRSLCCAGGKGRPAGSARCFASRECGAKRCPRDAA